jgi:hypothetical protein
MTKTDLAYLDGTIDQANAVIAGVSVITVGEAKGHEMSIDERTLEQVKRAAETYSGGLKVKTDHYTGFDNIVGTLKNFVIDGDQLRADLHLLKNHEATARILEMAELMPDTFGLSISFSGDHEKGSEGTTFARCEEIYSADLVDTPAANPTGLFSAKVDSKLNYMDEQKIADAIAEALAPVIEDMASLKAKLAAIEEGEDKQEMAEDEEKDKEMVEEEEDKEEMKKNDMAAELAEVKALLANFGAKPVTAAVALEVSKPSAKTPTNFTEALEVVKAEGLSGSAATKAVISRYPEIYLAARNGGIRTL